MIETTGSNGDTLWIDDEDIDLLQYKWYCSGGYFQRSWAKPKLHRVILERKLGRAIRPSMICDHINSLTYDNRRENLQEITQAENVRKRRYYP